MNLYSVTAEISSDLNVIGYVGKWIQFAKGWYFWKEKTAVFFSITHYWLICHSKSKTISIIIYFTDSVILCHTQTQQL